MSLNLLLMFLMLSVKCSVNSFEILGLFPHFGKSHQDVFDPLLRHLLKRGHQMTIVSHFPPKEKSKNWTHINMGDFNNFHMEIVDLNGFETDAFSSKFMHLKDSKFIADIGISLCEVLTKLPEIHDMLINKKTFDLIITEQFISDCSLGVAYLMNAPVVQLQSHILMPWSYDRIGLPDNPSYIPNLFLGFPAKMTFLQRVENTIFQIYYKYFFEYQVQNVEHKILERNLNATLPPLKEIAKNTSLLLSNTHYMLNGVKPLTPAVVEVGGMHLKRTTDPLNLELETFMNESKDGVILFSMGSMIKTTSFPKYKLQYFFEVFAPLKQRVIWKWEGERFPEVPENVFIMRWVPQFEILHHPKTVAFISHGGLLGTLEALHAGVPILFIPVFGDQPTNTAIAEENGLGVRVPYNSLTKEKLQEAMKKLLSPQLQQSAKSLSEAWRDRPDPLEVAADLVEHVIRHGGHRRQSPAQQLLPYQIYLLDVILFISSVLLTFMYMIYKIARLLMRSVCTMQNKSNAKDKKH